MSCAAAAATTKLLNWRSLPVSTVELSLADVLPTGQAFRWIKTGQDPVEWTGVIGNKLFSLCQTEHELKYYVHNNTLTDADAQILKDYFQLHISCQQLMLKWSKQDKLMASNASSGVRILKQDPVETLIAFICSSNNNIPRITLMINKLCACYGTLLGDHCNKEFYSFPQLKDLNQDGVEANLRDMGFGYRAKYVANAARYILQKHSPDWLESLIEVEYQEAWLALQELPGVGPKVADCVCLMGLGKTEAVPIDTHILQLAVKEYGVRIKGKTLTLKKYKEIGDMFRMKFGVYSGWAQAVLFRNEIAR